MGSGEGGGGLSYLTRLMKYILSFASTILYGERAAAVPRLIISYSSSSTQNMGDNLIDRRLYCNQMITA